MSGRSREDLGTADRPPQAAAGVDPAALGIPDVALRRVDLAVRRLAGRAEEIRVLRAVYHPTAERLLEVAGGQRFRCLGWRCVRFAYGPGRDLKPQELRLWVRRVQIKVTEIVDGAPRERWKSLYLAPPGFDLKTKVDPALVEGIKRKTGRLKRSELQQLTAVSRDKLMAIGGDLVKEDREARAKDQDFAARYGGLDVVHMALRTDPLGSYLTVAVKDPRFPKIICLDFIPVPKKSAPNFAEAMSHTVARLAAAVRSLPRPEALLAMAMDGDWQLLGLWRDALAIAARDKPALRRVVGVLDRWHGRFNVAKPFVALIGRLRKALPKGAAGARNRTLLATLRVHLLELHWDSTAKSEVALDLLTELFALHPELEEPYWVLRLFLDVQCAPGRESAERRYQAWRDGLSEAMRQLFCDPLSYLDDHYNDFMAYFEMKDRTRELDSVALSITSSGVESLNRRAKALRRIGPGSSAELFLMQMIGAYGYLAVTRQAALEARAPVIRRPRKTREADAEPNACGVSAPALAA